MLFWWETLTAPFIGQKQRVSLARAAYARPKVVLLDDPLSALDAGTAKLVFERLIKSDSALFSRTCAVVLVTHASHFLNRVDSIILIVEGKNKYHGTWRNLASFKPVDTKTKGAVEFILSSLQEDDQGSEKARIVQTGSTTQKKSNPERTHRLMTGA